MQLLNFTGGILNYPGAVAVNASGVTFEAIKTNTASNNPMANGSLSPNLTGSTHIDHDVTITHVSSVESAFASVANDGWMWAPQDSTVSGFWLDMAIGGGSNDYVDNFHISSANTLGNISVPVSNNGNTIAPIPEPSSVLLSSLAVLAIAGRRKR